MDRILIIDDEEHILELLDFNLSLEGYEVITTMSSLDGLDIIKQDKPDLVLLDWMLPKMSGIELLNIIRSDEDYDDIAVIMLTAKNMEEDKLEGLTIGADDYVTKPYNPQELAARVRSQLRRYTLLGDVHAEKREGEIVNGRLSYDPERRELKADGELVKLTATELKIVDLLMRNPGRVFPAEEIYQRVWQSDSYACENTVMVHIRRIREKIELNPKEPDYIKVVWGIGYKMEQHN